MPVTVGAPGVPLLNFKTAHDTATKIGQSNELIILNILTPPDCRNDVI